jgi:hypothetical protein
MLSSIPKDLINKYGARTYKKAFRLAAKNKYSLIGFDEDNFPIIGANRTPDGACLTFPCPFCGQRHCHGAIGPGFGAGDGHRAAHCYPPGIPGSERGYVIKEVEAVSK